MITPDGCWAEFRIDQDRAHGRPCLFLDRDGVLIEDTGYPHRAEDAVFIDATVDLVGAANRAGYVTGLVTNQSGIARGLFHWNAFTALQKHIDGCLQRCGATLDFVLACPHHGAATVSRYRQADHPWRKPRPGMLLEAASRLKLDRARSIMVGDREADMQAGAAAGLAHLWLLDETPVRTTLSDIRSIARGDLTVAFEVLARNERRVEADTLPACLGAVRSP